MQPSFFFYDYETTGIDPKCDRILQFAGIRTDLEFNIISDPIACYSQLSSEIIPNPQALLVTGITPEVLTTQGLPEVKFLTAIYREFVQPYTCVIGYNNIRFDDEFTRYAFYRNFFDPYAREWQNNNSRYDLIDLVRMCAALRPEGIIWPKNIENKPSFKLNDLTIANNLIHEKAHDALSDVYATIEIAKLITKTQPKLLNYLLQMRKKDFINNLLNLNCLFDNTKAIKSKLFAHSTRMVSSEYYATSVFLPLLRDPINTNGVICWDLRYDPELLLGLNNITDREKIAKLIYAPASELRLNLKTVFINKSPAIAPLTALNESSYQRIQLQEDVILKRAESILANQNKWFEALTDFFSIKPDFANNDVEHKLYDGFIANQDKYFCTRVLTSPEHKLIDLQNNFHDPRLKELMFRYRARNYPQTLSKDEQIKWQEYCQARLDNTNKAASISRQEFIDKCKLIVNDSNFSIQDQQIINQWLSYYQANQTINAIKREEECLL